MRAGETLLKSVIRLGLAYLQWTQLTPMLLFCGGGIVLVLLFTFVNFESQTFSLLERLSEWIMNLPVVGDSIRAYAEQKNAEEAAGSETIHLTTEGFKSFLFKTWAVISLIFMAVGWAASALFGPFKPLTLKRKLGILFWFVLVLMAGMAANYILAPENFNGGIGGWILNFVMMGVIIFVVSSYSLIVSHLIQVISDGIMKADFKKKEERIKL